MKGKSVFVDSNIWIYLYSTDAKASLARKTIDKHFKNIILSTQVIGEVFHSLSRFYNIFNCATNKGAKLKEFRKPNVFSQE